MNKIKFGMFCLLVIQILIISFSIYTLSHGEPSFLTYFNIILNSIFGIVNLIGILR
jgi:hypothetical protein